ncbi:hypothetical protein Tco_0931392 [Tanacetum coccineum]
MLPWLLIPIEGLRKLRSGGLDSIDEYDINSRCELNKKGVSPFIGSNDLGAQLGSVGRVLEGEVAAASNKQQGGDKATLRGQGMKEGACKLL